MNYAARVQTLLEQLPAESERSGVPIDAEFVESVLTMAARPTTSMVKSALYASSARLGDRSASTPEDTTASMFGGVTLGRVLPGYFAATGHCAAVWLDFYRIDGTCGTPQLTPAGHEFLATVGYEDSPLYETLKLAREEAEGKDD
jgi:hypothetical protein